MAIWSALGVAAAWDTLLSKAVDSHKACRSKTNTVLGQLFPCTPSSTNAVLRCDVPCFAVCCPCAGPRANWSVTQQQMTRFNQATAGASFCYSPASLLRSALSALAPSSLVANPRPVSCHLSRSQINNADQALHRVLLEPYGCVFPELSM